MNRLFRQYSTRVHHFTPAKTVRQLATPLAFVSVHDWDAAVNPASNTNTMIHWSTWADHLTHLGYSSLLINLSVPSSLSAATSSQETLAALEDELRMTLARENTAFPPVMFAQHLSALVAETYVSSHPLSGLFLSNPALASTAHTIKPEMMIKSELEEFTYEPSFPLFVQFANEGQRRASRFDKLAEEDEMGYLRLSTTVDAEQAFEQAKEWLDEEV